MRILILFFLLSSCDVVEGLIGAETDVDSDFNDSSCTGDCSGGNNNVTSLEDQIISFWRFEESGGTEDRSDDRGGNDFQHQSGTLFASSGQIGNSIDCSVMSSSSYMSASMSSNLHFGTTTDFTIAFWASLGATNGAVQVIYEATYGTPTFKIEVPSSTQNLLVNVDNGFPLTVNSAFPSLSTWYHFVIGVDRDAGLTVYRNGSIADSDSNTSSATNFTAGSSLYVCGESAASFSSPFLGQMDSLGIWDRLLNQDEIDALYNGNNNLDQ